MRTKAILSLAQALSSQSNDGSQAPFSISLCGGGFRALASHTGFLSGLFSIGAQMEGESLSEYSFSSLMENFDYISSNSGGTWFSAQFIYSANYMQMMENIAAYGTNTSEAAAYFTSTWTNAFLSLSNATNITVSDSSSEIVDLLDDLFADIDGSVEAWMGLLVNYIIEQNVDWAALVATILGAAGDFDYNDALNAVTPNSWAEGKNYVVASSIVLPPSTLATSGAFDETCINSDGDSVEMSIAYEYTGGSTLGDCSPIQFSTTLGDSTSDPSPMPFMYLPSNQSFSVEYSYLSEAGWFSLGTVQSVSSNEGGSVLPGPGMFSNQISIVDAATSSSAFFSATLSVENGTDVVALEDVDAWNQVLGLVIPVALNPNSTPSTMFSRGMSSINPSSGETCSDWFESVQSEETLSLADGGFIDNIAVAHITGAAEEGDTLTIIVDGSYIDCAEDLSSLFQGEQLGIVTPYTHVPVFAQDQDYIRTYQDNLPNMTTVSGASQLLAIAYGTIPVTTADQPYFNVVAGINLTLNVIIVYSNQGDVPNNWADIGQLAAEISSTVQLSANADAAEYIFNNFF